MEVNRIYLFVYCLRLLSYTMAQDHTIPYGSQNLNIWPLTEKVCRTLVYANHVMLRMVSDHSWGPIVGQGTVPVLKGLCKLDTVQVSGAGVSRVPSAGGGAARAREGRTVSKVTQEWTSSQSLRPGRRLRRGSCGEKAPFYRYES